MPRLFYLPLVEPGGLLCLKATKERTFLFKLRKVRLLCANVLYYSNFFNYLEGQKTRSCQSQDIPVLVGDAEQFLF